MHLRKLDVQHTVQVGELVRGTQFRFLGIVVQTQHIGKGVCKLFLRWCIKTV